jgi:hypothetical protein
VTKECSFFSLSSWRGSLVQAILRHPKMVGFSFRPECVKRFIYLRRALRYFDGMRGVGIIIIALVVLSATVRGQPHVVLRPTGPLPAVNVP